MENEDENSPNWPKVAFLTLITGALTSVSAYVVSQMMKELSRTGTENKVD